MKKPIDKTSPRILEYRKHYKTLYTVWKTLCILFAPIIWACFRLLFSQGFQGEHHWIYIGIICIYFFNLYFTLFNLRTFALAKIQAFPDHIFIRNGKKVKTIPYSEIQEIKPFGRGHEDHMNFFSIIMKSGKKYSYFGFLERPEYIIEAILANNPTLLSEEKRINLLKGLLSSDHSSSFFYRFFANKKNLLNILGCFLLTLGLWTLLMFIQLHELRTSDVLEGFVSFLFLLLFINHIGQSIILFIGHKKMSLDLGQRLTQNFKDKRIDLQKEKLLGQVMFRAYLCSVFVVVGVCDIFNVNFVYQHLKLDELPHAVWVNEKSNCLDCRYRLKKSHEVVVNSGSIQYAARIMALPGEEVRTLTKGRDVASATFTTVPADFLAVQTKTSTDAYDLIPLKAIRGRIVYPKQRSLNF